MLILARVIAKTLHTLSISLKKLRGQDRNIMDFAAKQRRKARETYWMHELRTIFSHDLNDKIGDEFKTDYNTLMLLLNFHICQENIVVLIVVKTTKVFPVFYHKYF